MHNLLAEQSEAVNLEYKRLRDLDTTEGVVKLALDVAAMQSEGGYIVLGVDDRGVPTGEVSARHADLLDEAVVHDKLRKYLPPPLELRIGRHEVYGARVVLIYVPRRRTGLTVLAAVGEFEANGRLQRVFAPGDIYVRRGTKKEKVTQERLDQCISEAASDAGADAEPALDVSPELELAGWPLQPPRAFHPPLGSADEGLVIRAQLASQPGDHETLIDSSFRRDLAASLRISPIEQQIGEFLLPGDGWWLGTWQEEGFNTTAITTLSRRPGQPSTMWARAAVVTTQPPHPHVPVHLLIDGVFTPKPKSRLEGGTTMPDGFEARLSLRQLYNTLHASMASACKLDWWLVTRGITRRSIPPQLAVFIEASHHPLTELIDFGDWREVPGADFSTATWELAPSSVRVDNTEDRDRFVKRWLTKTMINGGLRDFEYQLDGFVPRHWPL